MTDFRIDADRLLGRIKALGEIGRDGEGRLTRLAASDADRAGRKAVAGWMREAGLEVMLDRIGNLFGIWRAGAPDATPLVLGSHIDTVIDAGIYDGCYGVLGGLEVVQTLREAGFQPARPIAVAAFTNEEGVRYAPDMLGALVHAGGLGVEEALATIGIDGTVLGEELARIGQAGPHEPGFLRPHAYLELHIEQGPVLEREGVPIGAVENLQGISWQRVTIEGEANHAGTTPMSMRRDAGQAAARVVTWTPPETSRFDSAWLIHCLGRWATTMAGQPGFFDVADRLRELSAKGDDLERIAALVEFERFRPQLEQAVPRSDGTKGGRPAFDHVLMFKVLLLQAMHALSDERAEYLIKDRLSFMRFLGLGLADPVPDANTIWAFREALKRSGAVDVLFARFDATLRDAGYLAMGGQIVDASIVAAPKQRNTEAEKAAIKAGQIPEGWAEKPAKLRQKDRDARWTVKFSKAKPREDGAPQVDLAVPAFGYKNHVSIDRRHGLIRRWTATDAAAHDGARLAELIDGENTASGVWADTAYRSTKNEAMLAGRGLVSRIHRKKPKGRPMAERTRRANARKSAVRAAVEHVFARQKGPMGLVIRTIGIARARVKIGLANLAYNMKRFVWLSGKGAAA